MCSASGYYAWLSRSPSTRERADRALRDRIVDIHSRSRGTYGAPRIHAELAADGIVPQTTHSYLPRRCWAIGCSPKDPGRFKTPSIFFLDRAGWDCSWLAQDRGYITITR